MSKVEGTIVHPQFCAGCKHVKLLGSDGRAFKERIDMANPPAGLIVRCKATRRTKENCKNWTEDIDTVDKMFGMYDIAPNYPECENCVNFEGGDCDLVHYQSHHAKWVPKKDPDACIKWRDKKFLEPGSDAVVVPGEEDGGGEGN